MEHLYNNSDMADIHISTVEEQWLWGPTSKEFMGHKLVLCTASPVFHQLFFPSDTGPEIPACLSINRSGGNGLPRLDIDGVPPIAVETLLEYCYKDRFEKSDYENGYSRNLLWRLWHLARILQISHLFQLCSEALDSTICDETVFWDLNYSMKYKEVGTDTFRNKVNKLMDSMGNSLFTHPNLVFLDQDSVRAMLTKRIPASSEPLIVFNNVLRWALHQVDRTICEEVDGKKDGEIPVGERCRVVARIRQEKVKEFTAQDIDRHLERVLDLVPYSEFCQQDFLEHVASSEVLTKEMLLSATLSIMEEVVHNPERLTKSAYLCVNDPNVVKSELGKAMDQYRTCEQTDFSESMGDKESPRRPRELSRTRDQSASRTRDPSITRPKGDIKSTLEAARQRRMALENERLSRGCLETDLPTTQQSNLLLVE